MMKVQTASRLKEVKEYFFSKKLSEIAEMNKKGLDVINLGIGNPDMSPSQQSIEKLIQSAQDPNNHGYQSYSGVVELRDAYCNWYEKFFDVELNNLEVFPLAGSKEGIFSICMAFLNPGDKVLIPNPGYPAYKSVVELSNAIPIEYNLTEGQNWMPDFNELEKLVLLNDIKMMWLNYPNMPTGTRGSTQLMERIVEFAKRNQLLVINDNPYSFILNDKPLSILQVDGAKDIAIELNSLSKSHNMAGWRLGMVAANESFINAIKQVKSNIDSGIFLPLQEAAAIALKSDWPWYNKINEIYFQRRAHTFQLLDILKCQYNSGQMGMFVWAKIPSYYKDSYELSEDVLLKSNVFITPGSIFGSNGNRYARLSLCNPVSRINEAINRIYSKF